MLEELRKIRFARFRLELEAADRLHLPPYKGSTFRGAFGNSFKRMVCVKRDRHCPACLIRERCAYSYLFETPAAPERPGRRFTFAPHPFVIEPPEETQETYEPGDRLCVGLVLVGRAIEYLPYFIYAFEEMGARGLGRGRGRAALVAVSACTPEGERRVYAAGAGSLEGTCPVRRIGGPQKETTGQVSLHLRTPTRLKEGGRYTGEIDFPLLVRSLLRRSSDLARFHCGEELDLEYRDWIDRAGQVRGVGSDLRWRDWERYSHRQGQKMKLGGLVGRIGFAGELGPFMPLLRLGELLHVGKGTAFGLGRYEIE